MIHMMGMNIGCPVPDDLQKLQFKLILFELSNEVLAFPLYLHKWVGHWWGK